MAVGITASYFSNGQTPAYQVNVTGLTDPVGEYTYTVTRVSTSTFATGPVRNMDTILIVAATDFQYDYEFSMTEQFYYRVDVSNVSGVVVGTAQTSSINGQTAANDLRSIFGNWGTVLIRSTQQPALNQLVQINNFQTWTKSGRVLANLPVLQRRNPVIITDKSGSRTGTFTILQTVPVGSIGYPNTQQDIEDLLDYGDTLMFQCLLYSPLYRDMYFKVTDVAVTRPNVAIQQWFQQSDADQGHLLTYDVTFIEVDRPTTQSQQFTVVTWNDIKNGFATWQDVLDNNDRWLDVLNIQ